MPIKIGLKTKQDSTQAGAKIQATNIPNWSTYTMQGFLDWHNANIASKLPVANLTEANALLNKISEENKAFGQMLVALRNRAWPDLQDS